MTKQQKQRAVLQKREVVVGTSATSFFLVKDLHPTTNNEDRASEGDCTEQLESPTAPSTIQLQTVNFDLFHCNRMDFLDRLPLGIIQKDPIL